MKKRLCAGFVACLALAGAVAQNEKTAEPVYMYGVATSLMDSVMYVTPIQRVEGATLDEKTRFLNERSYYSEQLRAHLASQGLPESVTCAVCFGTKQNKLQKKWLKLKSSVGKAKKMKSLTLQELPADSFRFEAYQQESTSE